MDLKTLKRHIEERKQFLKSENQSILKERLERPIRIFPFNEYEYSLMFLLNKKAITIEQYEKLRNDYMSANKNLNLYGLAPRIFGQVWGEEHITMLDSRFQKPNKLLDPQYDGEYDLIIEQVKVEVKAGRAIHTKKRGDLVSKALRYNSRNPFWMNFQQLKLDVCDVFVFMGVWVDRIVYWVMSNDEVKSNKYLSHQHRGGVEYQIGIKDTNLHEFDIYKSLPKQVGYNVIKKGK